MDSSRYHTPVALGVIIAFLCVMQLDTVPAPKMAYRVKEFTIWSRQLLKNQDRPKRPWTLRS